MTATPTRAELGEEIALAWMERARATYRGGAEVRMMGNGSAFVRSEHFECTCTDTPAAITEALEALLVKELGRKARMLMRKAAKKAKAA